MRKIITTTFVTLDGVMQAPGGPEEDKSNGFKYGGWQFGKFQDEITGKILNSWFAAPFELLLGRITYDIFAAFWPTAKTDNEVAVPFNTTKKYVVTHESTNKLAWHNSHLVTGDLPAPRPGLFYVYVILCDDDSMYIGQTNDIPKRWNEHKTGTGSEHTKRHKPVAIIHYEEFISREAAVKREQDLKTGFGRKWLKREWQAGRTRQAGGTQPALWKLVDSKISTTGVIIASYEPAGELKTGTVGA